MPIYKSHISKFLVNKYSKIYYQIIDRALSENRKKTKPNLTLHVYYELHHILPRSVYPEFVNFKKYKWNGVLLTAREHFVAHKLLVRICSTDVAKAKMLHAVMYLITSNKDNRIIVTSREYEWYREQAASAHSLLISGKYAGKKASSYGKKWYSNLTTGQNMQYLPSEVPPGWELGRKAFTKGNNSVGGTKWFHNPTTGEKGMYKPGEEPIDWIKGRGNLLSRGKATYYDPGTGETRRFIPGQEPSEWLSGNYKLRGKKYNKNRCKNISEGLKNSSNVKKRKVMCAGILYNSIREAGRELKVDIHYRCNSDKFPDYYFIDN